jgi:hypothetical protein
MIPVVLLMDRGVFLRHQSSSLNLKTPQKTGLCAQIPHKPRSAQSFRTVRRANRYRGLLWDFRFYTLRGSMFKTGSFAD